MGGFERWLTWKSGRKRQRDFGSLPQEWTIPVVLTFWPCGQNEWHSQPSGQIGPFSPAPGPPSLCMMGLGGGGLTLLPPTHPDVPGSNPRGPSLPPSTPLPSPIGNALKGAFIMVSVPHARMAIRFSLCSVCMLLLNLIAIHWGKDWVFLWFRNTEPFSFMWRAVWGHRKNEISKNCYIMTSPRPTGNLFLWPQSVAKFSKTILGKDR